MRALRIATLLILIAASAAVAGDLRIMIFDPSQGIAGWESKSFAGKTEYTLGAREGRMCLHAASSDSASALIHSVDVDLEKTPYLHWSWRIAATMGSVDERTRKGDDYPARIYIVFARTTLFSLPSGINYVWTSQLPAGTVWTNAFVSRVRMIAIRSGMEQARSWIDERRNVLADARSLFGEDVPRVVAVGLMTDSDNTGGRSSADYGQIWFAND
ncbi:MAG: DUF3047 domain-containing protein [Thermoanaerobaculia bacterium]